MSWWKWLLVLAVHFYALYAPGSGEPGIFDVLPAGTDKVIHVALFAVPTFLARVSIRRWWPVLLLAVHAPISELVQWRFIPYRSGDPLDLAADLLGIAVGVGVAELVRRRVLAPDADHAPVE